MGWLEAWDGMGLDVWHDRSFIFLSLGNMEPEEIFEEETRRPEVNHGSCSSIRLELTGGNRLWILFFEDHAGDFGHLSWQGVVAHVLDVVLQTSMSVAWMAILMDFATQYLIVMEHERLESLEISHENLARITKLIVLITMFILHLTSKLCGSHFAFLLLDDETGPRISISWNCHCENHHHDSGRSCGQVKASSMVQG